MTPPVKRSISFAARHPETGRVLAVRRPPDDDALPDAWGLPAGSLLPGEGWAEAVRRAAREKLGVEVSVDAILNQGRLERADHILHMRLYGATITAGRPDVSAPAALDDVTPGITRYVDWKWAEADLFEPAAARGSLCCALYLEVAGGP